MSIIYQREESRETLKKTEIKDPSKSHRRTPISGAYIASK